MARKLSIIDNEVTLPQTSYVIYGSEDGLDEFLSKAPTDLPVMHYEDRTFFKHTGGSVPVLIYVEDGVLKKRWEGDSFDAEEVKALAQRNQ